MLPVGDSVTLFDGAWLASVLEHWEDTAHAHDAVPKQLVEHRDEVLSSWRLSEGVDHFAAVRVDVGPGNIANVLDRAKDSAEALLRLAATITAPASTLSMKSASAARSHRSPRRPIARPVPRRSSW